MDYERVKEVFEKYVENYDQKEEIISLKREHSLEVANLMAELAFRLNLSKEEIILAKIIGLLHDIGRFEQFRIYGRLSDRKTIDHADQSCIYLFEEGHIRDFIEEDKYDQIIELAIRYHNKLDVPPLKDKEKLFVSMIRDMDKVDIFKQYAVHYHYVFKADEVTPTVLKNFKERHLLDIKDNRSKSDAVLSILAFIYDFNFEESLDILVETDNFDLFVSTIEVAEDSEKLWLKVREICYDAINEGIHHE